MSVTASMVSELRERTNCGIKDCKSALTECDGDMEKAVEYLRKKGLAVVGSKSGRSTTAGRIFSYIHSNGQIGVLLELGCETDFVANTEQFQELGKDLCMHICAMTPVAVDREQVPAETVAKEKDIYREQMKKQLKGKPEDVQEKMLTGKLGKFFQDVVLLEQPHVKDDKRSVKEIVEENIATLKENITVKRFSRFKIGE